MLRITVERSADGRATIRLEGRFAATDLGVFEDCVARLRGEAFALDLAELRWMDPQVVERLSQRIAAGARVVASSPFLERLLGPRERDSRATADSATRSSDPRSPESP